MKRLAVLLIFSVCLAPTIAYSQDFDAQFKAFEEQSKKSFQNFSDSINKVFAEAMTENMRVFKRESAKVKDPKPKPVTPPSVKPGKVPQDLPHQEPVKKEPVKEEPVQEEPIEERPVPKEPENEEPKSDIPNSTEESPTLNPPLGSTSYNFNLFGRSFSWMTAPIRFNMQGIQPSEVSDFWIRLSEWDYETLVEVCKQKRKEDNFNDWAICQLVFQMAEEYFPNQYDEQVVFSIFMLNQMGMEAKVGFFPTHLFCLIAIEQQVYGVNFATISNRNYYFFELNPNESEDQDNYSFRTYNHTFPGATQQLDMRIQKALRIEDGTYERLASQTSEKKIFIDENLIELYSTYPQVELEVYANAVPSEIYRKSVKKLFGKKLQGLSQQEAVALLLSYVQFSFEYATDDEQFGYEKPFFCEESYYYPKNDCEDRSVLFSFLVCYLLDMDVVLIDYPGHIATAVHFDQDVKGSNFTYRGKTYVICDPTFTGAPIGMEMPDYTPADRTIVPLQKMNLR